MRYLFSAVLVLVLVSPAVAQDRSFDLTANAVWFDATGGGEFEDLADPADIEFDAQLGYGLAANVFFSDRVSVEFALSRIDQEAQVRRRAVGPAFTRDVEIMPVTAVLQWHFAPGGTLDPYIGVGAAYVLLDDIEGNGVANLDRIDLDDDVGLAINAGLGIRLGDRFGITLDGKYVPLESNATAVIVGGGETEGRVDLNPIILSAGLSLRF